MCLVWRSFVFARLASPPRTGFGDVPLSNVRKAGQDSAEQITFHRPARQPAPKMNMST